MTILAARLASVVALTEHRILLRRNRALSHQQTTVRSAAKSHFTSVTS